MASDQTVPLGTTESYPLPGVVAMLRVEPQVWSRDASGALVQGCWRSGAIYLPAATGAGEGVTAPSDAGLNRTVALLTAASLAVGTAATVATWGKK